MIVVALAMVAAFVLVTATFAGVVRSLIRQHARERDLLINQVCNLAGKPWQPAPARDEPEPEERPLYMLDPEQYPPRYAEEG